MIDTPHLLDPNPDGTWTLDDPAHRCARGWVGEDSEGRPVPCLTCKPHLRRHPAEQPTREDSS